MNHLKILGRNETTTLTRLLQKLDTFVSILPMPSEIKARAWALSLLIPCVRDEGKCVLFSIDDQFYGKEQWHLPIQHGNCNSPDFSEMCRQAAKYLLGQRVVLEFKGIISPPLYKNPPLVITALCEASNIVETNATRFFPLSSLPRPIIRADEEIVKRL